MAAIAGENAGFFSEGVCMRKNELRCSSRGSEQYICVSKKRDGHVQKIEYHLVSERH